MAEVITMSELEELAIHTLMPWVEYLTHLSYPKFFILVQEPYPKVSCSGSTADPSRQRGTSLLLARVVDVGTGEDQ